MNVIRFWAICCLLVVLLLVSPSCLAQNPPVINQPPMRSQIDANDVDLASGRMLLSVTDLSIGPNGPGGLAHTRIWSGNGWVDAYAIYVTVVTGGYNVSYGGRSIPFTCAHSSGAVCPSKTADGSTLTVNSYSTSVYTFTDRDGVVTKLNSLRNYYGYLSSYAYEIDYPTGERIFLAYFPGNTNFDPTRLASVSTNSGFDMEYVYNTTQSDATNPYQPTQVVVLNNALDYCTRTSATSGCSGLTQSWPTTNYAVSGSGTTYETDTDPIGRVTRYTRNSSVQMVAIKRPSSSTDNETIAYDTNGRVQTVSNTSAAWTYSWSLSGTTLSGTMTDPLSHQRLTTADTTQNVLITDRDALTHVTTYAADANGRITKVTAPEGNYTQYVYDGRGNVTSITSVSKTPHTPADITTLANYPATCTNPVICNKPSSSVDADNNETDYGYDNITGLLTSVAFSVPTTGSVQPQTRYSYSPLYAYYKNSSGSIVAAAVPISKLTGVSICATTASCAGTADEIKTTVAYGPQTAGTANNLLPVAVSKGSGDGVLTATTSSAYDMIGNIYTINGPLSGTADTTRYRFDAVRQLTGVVGPDPDGAGILKYRARRYTYNLDGQVIEVEQGTVNSQLDSDWSTFAPIVVRFASYDNLGRQTDNLLGDATHYIFAWKQYSYDAANRLDCAAIRMNRTYYGSLPASACTATASGSFGPDRITKYGYDAVDRPLTITTGYGVVGTERVEVTNTYSPNGRVATVADARGNLTTYEYDGFDRLSKTRYPLPGGGGSSTTDFAQSTYDAASNITSLRRRDGLSIGFSYDHLNRPTSKDLPGTEPDVSYTYDNLGRTKTVSQPGNALSFTYDALSRTLTQAGPLGTMTSQWDLAGRRTKLTWPDGFYVAYDYLLTGEMTGVRENGATSGVGVLASLAYDDLGRRVTMTRGNATTTSYGYDTTSHLTSLTQDLSGSASDQSQGFSYNPASQIFSQNKTNDSYAFGQSYNTNRNYTVNGLNQYSLVGSTSVTYDGRGNISGLSFPYAQGFAYSSENLLTAATGATGISYDPMLRLYQFSASTTTRFAYDGMNVAGEYDGGNALQRRYVFGPGADEPLVWYEGSGTTDRRWLHADERGSITAITNSAGTPIAINSYDENGVPSTANIGRFQYTGQAWLPDISLYYFKTRMYSASLGRFLQTDSTGYLGGLNAYNYASSDAVNEIDPYGLDGEEIVVTAPEPFKFTFNGLEAGTYDFRFDPSAFSRPFITGRYTNNPINGSLAGQFSISLPNPFFRQSRLDKLIDGGAYVATVGPIALMAGVEVGGAIVGYSAGTEGLIGLADSNAIRFTQDSVSGTFRNGSTIQDMVNALRSGELLPEDIEPIRVFEKDGFTFSLDNRRLLAAQLAGSPVNTIAATEEEVLGSAWKFTTPNNGCYICLRNGTVQ